MSFDSHISALERKHHDLDREIRSEMANLSSDDIHVGEMKRQKLALKDEIHRLQEQSP